MTKFSLSKDPFREREKLKYPKPIPSREYIMQCLQKLPTPPNYEKIITIFGLRSKETKDALKHRLSAMLHDGQLIINRRGNYLIVDKTSLVRGTIVGSKEGFGFLIPEDGGKDIFLPPKQMNLVFPNDRVLVQVVDPHKQGRHEGVIIEILEHNTKQIVGKFCIEHQVGYVISLNKNINQSILIPEDHVSVEANQIVLVEITSYPTKHNQAIGKIIKVLGNHMSFGMEEEIAINTYNLPHQWNDGILNEVASLPTEVNLTKLPKRKNLGHLPFVTIDGEDAKDFDDAVYCEPNLSHGWHLYVAIADVSHYVKPDTEIDKEALARGNSVYFPKMVIPMLPEELSNELCSLKPKVNRLCLVCEMAINQNGKIMHYKFYPATISSHARLTYTEVGAMLENKKSNIDKQLTPHLKNLHNLYKALNKQRIIRGAISFSTIETKIIFAKNRRIQKIEPVIRNVAHFIIEECMLAANVCAARFLWHKKIPALYRVHEQPDEEKLNNLRIFLHGLGLSLGGDDHPEPSDYADLIKQIKGRKDEHLIQTVLLRSMRQAVYDEENLGHFSLAYEAYGHFTSPIRRYPDLLTHRAIYHALEGGDMSNFYYQANTIHNFGEHCSMTERRADEATYAIINWLKCEYMRDKIGEKFTGIISGVTGFGVFIELKNIYVEGLLHITSLPNDYYQFDPGKYCLIGKRTNHRYRLGDELRIQVLRVNIENREIDFGLVK